MAGTKPYDDAELAAVELVRRAVGENNGEQGFSDAVIEVHARLTAMYPDVADIALIGALSRFGANAVAVLAHSQGRSADELLDGFELHKLSQHHDEEGGDEYQ